MTLVWCPGMGDKWLHMSAINGLKQLLQASQAMDDGDDSSSSTTAAAAAVAGQYDISEMMFAGSSDASAQPVLDAESAAALASKKRKEEVDLHFLLLIAIIYPRILQQWQLPSVDLMDSLIAMLDMLAL
jgi:hypothetical protein